MFESLLALQKAGVVDTLDAAFGEWIAERSNDTVALFGALVSAEVAKGHVCLDLNTAENTLKAHDITPPENWCVQLAQTKAVAKPCGRAPLVLDGDRLYLHRYWTYETRIAEALRKLAEAIPGVGTAELKTHLRELFPDVGTGVLDRQALAAAIGATRRLAILSGGPGTGKTTTVLKLIALALMLDPALTVALAAPTGKAASRLGEIIERDAGKLPAAVREQLPREPQTLHRLLGYNPATQAIRHDAGNPLDADLVVVDEASMVDMGLMARLLAALKPDARLVLVGDRNQLASVEAGAVLGDICLAAGGFPDAEAGALEAILGAPVPRAGSGVSPISASIALLKRNYRFGEAGIGALAKAVVAGDADAALVLLKGEPSPPPSREEDRVEAFSTPSPPERGRPDNETASSSLQKERAGDTPSSPSPRLRGEGWGEGNGAEPAAEPLIWHTVADERSLSRELHRIVKTCFQPILNATSASDALAQLGRFRLLAAERRGPFGVEGLNSQVETILGVRSRGPWYRGQPVLITENDYELKLFNGDFGIVWPDDNDRMKLWVTGADSALRAISPARLPAHETCYALTVHKAQGSEFDRVALVLPPRESRVATRELVYTGVTRGRQGVEVWATESVLRTAIATPIRRASGLAARLRDNSD